ncbi:hypothetical protein BDR06DRAFT_966980 [Suillus hirtellus]|nr:hypothetical protein BDR06DRAFT_966980 [Suillus hirtellus]
MDINSFDKHLASIDIIGINIFLPLKKSHHTFPISLQTLCKMLVQCDGICVNYGLLSFSNVLILNYSEFEALMQYTCTYENGELHAIPIPGSPFWPTESQSMSSDEEDLWSYIEDLSEQMSKLLMITKMLCEVTC